MFCMLDCACAQQDFRLIGLAVLICLLGCFTACSFVTRAMDATERVQHAWTAGAAVLLSCSVWTTFFVGVLAIGPTALAGYDALLTTLSIVAALLVAWLGCDMALMRNQPAWGGAILGFGIGGMQYLGFAAMRGPESLHYDAPLAIASLVWGTLVAAAAARAATQTMHWRCRLLGALLFMLAIVGALALGAAAVTLSSRAVPVIRDAVLEPEWVGIAVAAVTVVIGGLGLIGAVLDQHLAGRAAREAIRLRAHVNELEATRRQLEATASSLVQALDAAAAGSQAKSQFLATMSHELRTPLNAVIGFAEILETELFGPLGDARYREYVHNIRESGAHLLALINDVLDLSKLDAGSLALKDGEVEVGEIAGDALRMVSLQAAESGITIVENIPDDVPMIVVDVRRIRQVVLNLLSNAVKFTPAGGTVEIAARCLADGSLLLKVRDTGIGMAREDIPKALERFGQVDSTLARRYEGAGLGLPLSKGLVELHGGTLVLESEPGVGTTVSVTLPAHRVLAPAGEQLQAA